MAYTKQSFTKGQTLKAEHLNNMEIGIFNNDAAITANTTAINNNTTNISKKQDTLVSGTNIKTINGNSLLGSGNIVISGGSGDGSITVDGTYNPSSSNAQAGTAVNQAVGQVQGNLDLLENDLSDFWTGAVSTSQIFNYLDAPVFNGYCNGINYLSSSAHRIVSVPCKPGTVYTVSGDTSVWLSQGVYSSPEIPAANGSASNQSNVNVNTENGRIYYTFTTGAQDNYIAMLVVNNNKQAQSVEDVTKTIMVAEGEGRTAYIGYGQGDRAFNVYTKDESNKLFTKRTVQGSTIMGRKDTMTAGDSIVFETPNIKKNNVIGFHANITTLGNITIGQGRAALNQTAYIVITPSTVEVWRWGASEAVKWIDLTHNLTISDYLDVCIEVSNTEIGWAKLRLQTAGGTTYTYDRMAWLGCGDEAYVEIVSGTFTNCTLTHGCIDYDSEVWAFGDSYFDHWVAYALKDGYANFLCDGWSGRRSAQAMRSLKLLLEHNTPTSIFWAMGMNDGDSGSAVNTNWATTFSELLEICDNNGIKPILCTIPSTPTVNNTYKNEIIRTSGREYIDLDKAVGADKSTSWFEGLLSTDNVHPSTLGDEVIARFIETQLPQIKNK